MIKFLSKSLRSQEMWLKDIFTRSSRVWTIFLFPILRLSQTQRAFKISTETSKLTLPTDILEVDVLEVDVFKNKSCLLFDLNFTQLLYFASKWNPIKLYSSKDSEDTSITRAIQIRQLMMVKQKSNTINSSRETMLSMMRR